MCEIGKTKGKINCTLSIVLYLKLCSVGKKVKNPDVVVKDSGIELICKWMALLTVGVEIYWHTCPEVLNDSKALELETLVGTQVYLTRDADSCIVSI